MTRRLLYGAVRFAQRISLLWLMLATVIYWTTIITTVTAAGITENIKNMSRLHSDAQNNAIKSAVSGEERIIIIALVVSVLLTAGLAMFHRVRKGEKRMLLDAAAVIVFCLCASLYAQPAIRDFMQSQYWPHF